MNAPVTCRDKSDLRESLGSSRHNLDLREEKRPEPCCLSSQPCCLYISSMSHIPTLLMAILPEQEGPQQAAEDWDSSSLSHMVEDLHTSCQFTLHMPLVSNTSPGNSCPGAKVHYEVRMGAE